MWSSVVVLSVMEIRFKNCVKWVVLLVYVIGMDVAIGVPQWGGRPKIRPKWSIFPIF